MTVVKSLLPVFLCVVMLFSLTVEVFADPVPAETEIPEETSVPAETEVSAETSASGDTNGLDLISSENAGNTQVNVIVADYGLPGSTTPDGESWLDGGSGDGLIESLFGSYRPYDSSGVAAVDWGWIADVVTFLLMIFCLFKLLGGVIRRG